MAEEVVAVPLNGEIISVNVKLGDEVKEGDELCVVEAMKMETPIVTPVTGKVIKLEVTAGQTVKPGEIIAVIEYIGNQ
ncbi:unnamed protein product [marine sediment metagenome]|uniref:Lipoyl-binding domain-containing protein n=1 Tax=marine sediment metagenome TaxID=412755 RepID=X1GEA6_9ZZZZ